MNERLVVKVGSSSLVDAEGRVARRKLSKVVREVAAATGGGRRCVLVTSGAIASGLVPMGLTKRPKDMPGLQAAAAVGQGRLMAEYTRLFAARGVVAAQVLLTQEDVVRRRHFVNARNTIDRLLEAGVVPVVNENDTVATAEIAFGDNDRLAALVAVMIGADLLVLLSDVDGIYTRDPRRGSVTRARLVAEVTDPSSVKATGPGTGAARGGMASKLEAAGIATAAGIAVVVAGAHRRDVLPRILAGEQVGTYLPPRASRKRARKAWIAFASGIRGRVLVDPGAERAVREDGRSLLAAGVTGVEGDFDPGDPVEVAGPSGRVFARGIANYSSRELPRLAGRSSAELTTMRGGPYDKEVIHRDELVVMP
ncbi:MAG: glutamate 5-kinase [Actinomycetota bacterium]